MLNKVINSKKMGYYSSDGSYHCEWQTVVDWPATNAKIAECERQWQSEVDECNSQIQQYAALKKELNSKITEAKALNTTFNGNTEKLNAANIKHPATNLSGCIECVDNLISTYNNMVSQCDSEINDWQAKKSQALSKKGSCPADTPKVTRRECL